MKEKLDAVAYGLDPNYGAAYRALPDFSPASDIETYQHLITHLDSDSPHLVMASFSQVDLAGHSNDWKGYLRHIEIVDSLAVLTWNHLQSNPVYAGKTYMFITADHGRHDDAHGGFKDHGDECEGCRHIPFLALGPGVRAGYTTAARHTQQDVCSMVAAILGIPAPQAGGTPFDDIFEPEHHASARKR
jgi:phosphopentomutase